MEVVAPERIVFTYGYESGPAAPPGSSRVTITLDPCAQGTRLRLPTSSLERGTRRDQQGWRYQLAVFGTLSPTGAPDAAGTVDRWLAAWSSQTRRGRDGAMAVLTTPEAMPCAIDSAAQRAWPSTDTPRRVQRFMPGLTLRRDGRADTVREPCWPTG